MASPLQRATLQASCLSIISSVSAQLLKHYQTTGELSTSNLDYTSILQFLAWCLISTPPNFVWQAYLERTFPGYPDQPEKRKVKVDDDGKGVTVEAKLNIPNTIIKFCLDQTVGSALNTGGFLVGITALKGGTIEDCVNALQTVRRSRFLIVCPC